MNKIEPRMLLNNLFIRLELIPTYRQFIISGLAEYFWITMQLV